MWPRVAMCDQAHSKENISLFLAFLILYLCLIFIFFANQKSHIKPQVIEQYMYSSLFLLCLSFAEIYKKGSKVLI